MRVLAVDWSGRADGGRDTIWVAQARDGQLVFLENGRSRGEVEEMLVASSRTGERMVVGLDFAFSMPGWYVKSLGCESGPALWKLMAEGLAEELLEACEPPFWGRPGRPRPVGAEPYRRAERMSVGGTAPKSVFQIGGAGAVGTGSLRGMVSLWQMHVMGVKVWPFEEAGAITAVEIYPRVLTGPVVKSSAAERARYLERWPGLDPVMRERAASTEDAFDAAVSALVMWAHRDELAALRGPRDDIDAVEGAIWTPACAASPSCAAPGCARADVDLAWREHLAALVAAPRAARFDAVRALLDSLEDDR